MKPWLTASSTRPCESTFLSGSVLSTVGSMYWFHCPRKLKMPTLISPGLAIGSMTWKKVRVCEAPSIMAASATDDGSVRKNAVRKKTVNGSEYAM